MAIIQGIIDDIRQKRVYRRYYEKEDRKRRIAGQLLTLLANIVGIYYIIWLCTFLNWKVGYIAIPFLVAEILSLVSFDLCAAVTWNRRFHSPQRIPQPLGNPSVDIFITVCGEPVEMVRQTSEAAVKIDYPHKKIYLLDDGNSDKIQLLANISNCVYLNRNSRQDNKAGNLNYGLAHSSGELILTLDADQVCQAEMIKHIIGLFRFPTVAFVQTAQDFTIGKKDPFGNKEKVFYSVMQLGKDSDNSAFSCGSAVMYRRKALNEIGGFSSWNLVEDLHTSLRLHNQGWRSVYYNHSLSQGTAPEQIRDYYRQRQQWCSDSVRIILRDNSLFKKGLSFKQKLQYFHIGFSYLISGFVMPVFYIIPIWSFFTGNFLVNTLILEYAFIRLTLLVLAHIAHMVNNYPQDVHKPYQMWSGLFPVFIYGSLVALFSFRHKPAYRVTPKAKTTERKPAKILAVLPQATIVILTAVAIIYALINHTCMWQLFMVNIFWAVWIIWTLSRISLIGLTPS